MYNSFKTTVGLKWKNHYPMGLLLSRVGGGVVSGQGNTLCYLARVVYSADRGHVHGKTRFSGLRMPAR